MNQHNNYIRVQPLINVNVIYVDGETYNEGQLSTSPTAKPRTRITQTLSNIQGSEHISLKILIFKFYFKGHKLKNPLFV